MPDGIEELLTAIDDPDFCFFIDDYSFTTEMMTQYPRQCGPFMKELVDTMKRNSEELTDAPVYGLCTRCGALETRLNKQTGTRDFSSIGEHAEYPTGYGCELCS